MDIHQCIVSLLAIGMAMENGQEQFLDHQVKSLITNAVVNQEQKVILVAMNQGICSISRGNGLGLVNLEEGILW